MQEQEINLSLISLVPRMQIFQPQYWMKWHDLGKDGYISSLGSKYIEISFLHQFSQ